MATHSSVLAWRIPGTGEPGGLPPMGSHRVGHDWSDLAVAANCKFWRLTLIGHVICKCFLLICVLSFNFIVSFGFQKLLSLSTSHLFMILFPLFWEMNQKRHCCDYVLCFPLGVLYCPVSHSVFNSFWSMELDGKPMHLWSINQWQRRQRLHNVGKTVS